MERTWIMSKKTLLLSASYEVLSFISERKVFKLICKDKVDVLSTWEDYIYWGSGKMQMPATLRLRKNINKYFYHNNFSRKVLVRRDKSRCQYCGTKLSAAQITIDHVIPKSQGGKTSFVNCVTSCQPCNWKKANRTPEQANMPILNVPLHPTFIGPSHESNECDSWHEDWDQYIRD
jgi:uncharacterized protein with PIN domain